MPAQFSLQIGARWKAESAVLKSQVKAWAALKAFESCSTETAERQVFSGAKASKR
jgi:hypothetical protein